MSEVAKGFRQGRFFALSDRQVERRTVAPLPQVSSKGRLAGQPGTLLYATAVSLLGNPSHQLQYVSLVAAYPSGILTSRN